MNETAIGIIVIPVLFMLACLVAYAIDEAWARAERKAKEKEATGTGGNDGRQ